MPVLGKVVVVVVVVVVVQAACEALGTVLEPLESGSTRWRLDEVAHTPEWTNSYALLVTGDCQNSLCV